MSAVVIRSTVNHGVDIQAKTTKNPTDERRGFVKP